MSGRPRLTRRVQLEAPDKVADGAGGYAEGWRVLGVLWAEIEPGTGRAREGEGAALSRVAYRITVRGAPGSASYRPHPGQQFREGERVYRILAVAERDARAQFLTCFAEEEGAA